MKIGLARRGYAAAGGAERYLERLMGGLRAAGQEPVWLGDAPQADVRLDANSPRAFADAVRQAAGTVDKLLSLERVWECDVYRAGDGVHRSWLERRRAIEPRWRGALRQFSAKHRQLLELEEALFARGGAKRVIANSALARDEIVRFYRYPREKIEVVYNGVDWPSAPAIERQGKSVALFAGSGWARKGLRQAIAAAARLPGVELRVAGRGRPLAGATFMGAVRDMAPVYAAADFLVAPTLYDPFSNACLEALAAGLPVITTRANGFAEVMGAEDGAIIDDPLDIDALTDAMDAWTNRERIAATRESRLKKAAQFSVERNVRETLAALLR